MKGIPSRNSKTKKHAKKRDPRPLRTGGQEKKIIGVGKKEEKNIWSGLTCLRETLKWKFRVQDTKMDFSAPQPLPVFLAKWRCAVRDARARRA